LGRVNNDEEKLMNLLEKFVQNHTADFNEMQAQLEQSQWEELRSKAHAIRGAAANLGANELAQALNEIETAAVEMKESQAEEVLVQALGTFEALRENLSKVSRKRGKVRSRIVLDRKELKVRIEHLLQKVEDHDPTARDLINKISQAIPAGDLADSLTRIKVLLDNYDFKKAEVEVKRALKLLGSE
jgi:HPt (histidine-containing phosphotransfer) domain-containing protein